MVGKQKRSITSTTTSTATNAILEYYQFDYGNSSKRYIGCNLLKKLRLLGGYNLISEIWG
jgi:hypothetical protein